jgi:hypothetical protein
LWGTLGDKTYVNNPHSLLETRQYLKRKWLTLATLWVQKYCQKVQRLLPASRLALQHSSIKKVKLQFTGKTDSKSLADAGFLALSSYDSCHAQWYSKYTYINDTFISQCPPLLLLVEWWWNRKIWVRLRTLENVTHHGIIL